MASYVHFSSINDVITAYRERLIDRDNADAELWSLSNNDINAYVTARAEAGLSWED